MRIQTHQCEQATVCNTSRSLNVCVYEGFLDGVCRPALNTFTSLTRSTPFV